MSIIQEDVIDSISMENNYCVMTISDHLEWGNQEHIKLLEKKINFYLNAIIGGNINEFEEYSNVNNFMIQLIYKYLPSKDDENILFEISRLLSERGVLFEFGTLDEFY